MRIQVVPLGAGQDVGRSCILVTMGGKNILLDCGMHAGYHDDRRFPDFSYISRGGGSFDGKLDCVLISHFHLDHCGALPYFTEMVGYSGPIIMTHPTKAICPILLEDYRKLSVERRGAANFYTADHIKSCMKKVTTINLHQTLTLDEDFEVKAYYAGHVLGAVMFHIRVGSLSVVYTGDYNMTPDRHLGSAWIDQLKPDVLITESTYATMVRESKRTRERSLLKNIHYCVTNGGKVLIPVFALGRAQELFILIETYWERMGLSHIPVYFQAGLTMKANDYYKLFINWTNQKIKDTFVHRNMFDYKFIKPYDRKCLDHPGPMVIFATPAMLNAGASLEIFKRLAHDPKNMVLMPGFCEANTIGAKVLQGQRTIEMENNTTLQVNLQVKLLSFSAHADAKGILQLIRQVAPRHVILVHGDKIKMNVLRSRVMEELGIPCYDPANGSTVTVDAEPIIPIVIDQDLIKQTIQTAADNLPCFPRSTDNVQQSIDRMGPITSCPINGLLTIPSQPNKPLRLMSSLQPQLDPPLPSLELKYHHNIMFNPVLLITKYHPLYKGNLGTLLLYLIELTLKGYFQDEPIARDHQADCGNWELRWKSIRLKFNDQEEQKKNDISDEKENESEGGNIIGLTWGYPDEDLAAKVLSLVQLTLR